MPLHYEQLDLSKKSSWLLLVIVIVLGITLLTVFISVQTVEMKNNNQESLKELRDSLLSDSESTHTQWLKTLNPFIKKTEGSLIWHSKKQRGVMTFINLPTTAKNQKYHLWVYDLKQQQDKPISGGFFEKETKDKEVLVSIEVEKPVIQAYKFLILLEDTTNDEDNSDSHILLLAQP